MANAEGVDIASHENDVQPKAVDANGHETGEDLVDDKISIKSPTCERFSIRGYVATIRTLDRNTCWPFPQHLLQTRLEEAGNLALPPLEIPEYRWWNCESCLGDTNTSAERTIEKEYMMDSHASMQAYDEKFDRGCPMLLPTSNVDIQEKQKEDMLDCTEIDCTKIVEGFTVDLKSGDAVGSSVYDKEKKDEVITDSIREPEIIESIVSMELENDKSEIADLEEKKTGIPHRLSKSKDSEEIININDSDEKVECAEMVQTVVETMASFLVTKTKDELGLKKNKSEECQIPCQAPNSWEYFSRNKNIFKEISEKMKGKELEQASTPIVGSDKDANKLTHISNVPGKQAVLEGKDEKIISRVEPLTGRTMEFSIQNVDDSHISSDARNDVPCSNDNDSSCSEHMNISKITELKECTELSTSQVSLEKENVLLSEKTGKLKVSESRSKRKPQRKRLISDIIASKPSRPESWNKETEEFKSAHEMEENMCITENNKLSPRPKEDHVKVTIDAVKKSSKPTIDTSYGISEVNIDAEKNNVIIKKQRPEKLQVRKKKPGVGIESLHAFSTFVSKNSSTSSLSEAVTNALQMTQGTSLSVSASRDKSPQHNFLDPEYGQIGQKLSKMEDEIPMDIVELMAKNQHERGLSHLKHFHESHNLQKDRRRLKMKETNLTQVNKHVEGGIGLIQTTATPMSKAQTKQTGKTSHQASLKNHCQSDLLVDYGQIDVSQGVRDNSFISDKEGTTSGSCKGDLSMLQSNRCPNLWGKYSPHFVAPVLDETISACSLPFPIDGTKSHVSVTHCDQYGSFSSNRMVADSMQLQGLSTYYDHMKMQNLCKEGTPALSEFTGSGLPTFQNKSNSSLNCNGYSHQYLTSTDNPQNLTSQSLDLGNSGKTFDILSQSHNGNGIPNLSVRTDGSGPLYFNGKSNSAFLQHVNAQARQPFGKKHGFPSASVLRLMGQSVSVPAKCGNEEGIATGKEKCGNEESIATENGDNRSFSNLPQASSQKHANWFHPSGVMERSQSETFSCTERVFTGSEPIQDSMCATEKIMNSIKAIPPIPKFRPSGHYVPNGHAGIFTPSSAVPTFSGTERVFTGPEPIQDSMCVNEKITNSIKAIPPVPKYRPSGHYVSNGHAGIFTPWSAVPGDADVALESSNLRTKSPFRGTLLPRKKLKKGLQCTNGSDGNLKKFSTAPLASQSTKILKGSSSTKGLRSYRPAPMAMHLSRNHRSGPDVYIENRHHCFQSPWVLESNPQQNLTKVAEKGMSLELNKEYEDSASCGKNTCNVEICTLNRNPAEINIEGEEDGYSFDYDHFTLSHRDLVHSERKRDMTILQGQKRPRTLKRKHMQEFLGQKDGYVGSTAKTNQDTLDSLEQELTYVKELVGNIT